MTFNSLQFAAFFVVVLLLYYRFQLKGQNLLMILAGIIFYGAFDWWFVLLLAASTFLDFFVAQGLDRTDDPRRRKLLLATSMTGQLGILAYFKYFDFFSQNANHLLHRLGVHGDFATLNIVLPVAISFYTFQTLGYVFMVYRREWKAEKDLATFATFVSWFPALLAGPIGRPNIVIPQIKKRRNPPTRSEVESALLLILFGLVKKVVVADAVATYVDAVYKNPVAYGWSSLLLASVAFALEVYADFSGYSDIARGISRLLGVELARNFEQPFLSRDIREFWQRWHTSLASWFVDFVGRPLGGARQGALRAALNVMIIFSLIGLWHGPAWHFVLWGVYNGILIVIWRQLFPNRSRRHPMKLRLLDIPGIVFTFALFVVGAVLFRAPTIHIAKDVFTRILLMRSGAWAGSTAVLIPFEIALIALLDLLERRARIRTIEGLRVRARFGAEATPAEAAHETMIGGMPAFVGGLLVGLLAISIAVFSGGKPVPFIYFHF